MGKTLLVLFVVFVFIGGFLFFYNPSIHDIQRREWESKMDNQAGVVITVTLSNLSFESNEWKFDVIMDTHSVELDQDMTEIAILTDDSGKEYSPARWEGVPAGGPHREGGLGFYPITPPPQIITIKNS